MQDCWVGSSNEYRLGIRVIEETAWHSLFARNMFIQPTDAELGAFDPGKRGLRRGCTKTRPRRRATHGEHTRVVSDRIHTKRSRKRDRRSSDQYCHADGGRIRRVGPDLQADPRAGDVAFHLWLYRESGWYREGFGQGAASDVLDMFRRTVHAASSLGVCAPIGRVGHEVWVEVLAGECRLVGWCRRCRRTDADQVHAGANECRSRWDIGCRRLRTRSVLRTRYPAVMPSDTLNPRGGWADQTAYDNAAVDLPGRFSRNFEKFEKYVDESVKAVALKAA